MAVKSGVVIKPLKGKTCNAVMALVLPSEKDYGKSGKTLIQNAYRISIFS